MSLNNIIVVYRALCYVDPVSTAWSILELRMGSSSEYIE